MTVHVGKQALWTYGKKGFPAYKRGTPKNMVRDHYIVGMRSNNIVLDFPERSEPNFDCLADIFTFYYFLSKNCVQMAIFCTQNSKKRKFLPMSQNLFLNV